MAKKELESFIESPPTFSSISGKGKNVKGERASFGWSLLDIVSGGESHAMMEWMIDHTNEGEKYQTEVDLKKLKAGKGFFFCIVICYTL